MSSKQEERITDTPDHANRFPGDERDPHSTSDGPAFENFANPPIVEAILFIETLPNDKFYPSAVPSFYAAVSGRYRSPRRFREVRGETVIIEGDARVEGLNGDATHLLESSDGRQSVQIKRAGFGFNRFAPYLGWEQFRNEAMDLWNTYRNLFPPDQITSIALRYLNRMRLPFPFSDFKEYLRTYPELAREIDTGLAGFLMSLTLPIADGAVTGTLTQTVEREGWDDSAIPLVFDVEVVREQDIPGDEGIWDVLEELREFKNRLFFESITEKTKELFR
jgi:uncharacterized protein (TIGR04255 family)